MTQAVSSVREQIKSIVESSKVTFSQIARESGLSSGTISTWMNDKYQGDIEKVCRSLRVWLDNYNHKAELPEPPSFIVTPTARQIWTTCRFAQATESIAVVCGNPGVGKTKACEQYTRDTPNTWMITISPSYAGVRECLTELATELGLYDMPRHKGPLSRAIRQRLKGSQGLIIIDEADLLDRDTLEELRILQEATHVGLVLMGNDRVYTNLTGGRRAIEFARLFSRIAKRTAIRKTKIADVDAIADAWGVTGETERELLQRMAQKPGALRIINYTLRLASMTAHGNGDSLNEEYITKAFKDLDLDVDVSSILGGKDKGAI
ncbi:AAA family ATPase [Shewanella algae]|uniref:AAA family ATPase n=1 Tax=Shewanella algae TaxID=38313 RepID=UPI0031F59331